MKFAVRMLAKTNAVGEQISIPFIALVDDDGRMIELTGFERLTYPFRPEKRIRPAAPSRQTLHYIVRALNHISQAEDIKSISDITIEMIMDYFRTYENTPKRDGSETFLSDQSLDRCVSSVSNFFANLANLHPMRFTPNELLKKELVRKGRHSRIVQEEYLPIFNVKRPHSNDLTQFRDLPLEVAMRLVQLAVQHDPMIAFAMVLGMSSGLRPSEAMNVRQELSPLSADPGIKFSFEGTVISRIVIDLTREFPLRRDGVQTGSIKKERLVNVFKGFLSEVYSAYQLHLRILERYAAKIDTEKMPMFVLSNGQAMTYSTYRNRLRKVVRNHLVPELMSSGRADHEALAQILIQNGLNPHVFRHVFTVRLVSEGLDVAQVMYYRGDTSPESALTYLADKTELINRILETNASVLNHLAEHVEESN